jgi:hypothetical protein
MAKQKNLKTIEEIKKEGFCNKCCLCNKYVEEGLKTGKSRFFLKELV